MFSKNKQKYTYVDVVPDCKALTWLESFHSFKINSSQLDEIESIKYFDVSLEFI